MDYCDCEKVRDLMNTDYKNWMPKGMVLSFLGGAIAFLAAAVLAGIMLPAKSLRTAVRALCSSAALIFSGFTAWTFLMYRAFDYNGKRQMAKQIIKGTAAYVKLPGGGICLDVGCGSGALGIAVAKRNPEAEVIGIDRWGKEYASFSKTLCESNARAEGVSNIRFQKGDANRLDFPDEAFDAVVSNYVYHNIPGNNRQALLLETLRTLKKGGTFAIHDIFSASKYGDMQAFVRKLKSMGYQEARIIDTTKGKFMKPFEAAWMGLSGSAILTGRK